MSNKGQVTLKFQDKDLFIESIHDAFKAAEDGDNVEIWQNGDYYSLEFITLEANGRFSKKLHMKDTPYEVKEVLRYVFDLEDVSDLPKVITIEAKDGK